MLQILKLKKPYFNLRNTTELAVIRFFFTMGLAFINTVLAIYLKSYGLTDSQVGYFNSFLIVVSIIFLFFCVQILERFLEHKSFIASQILIIITLILFVFTTNIYMVIFLSILLSLLSILRENSFNILFRDNTKDETLNKDEGFLVVIGNLAWFTGPIMAGLIFVEYGFSYIFMISAAFVFISFILYFKVPKPKLQKIIKKKKKFSLLFRNFIKNKKVFLPYTMSLGISFWWAMIFIYVPLFILSSGIGEEYIGYFLGLTQLPLILFEFYVGKKSKTIGFKKFFIIGYFLVGIIAISCFFITNIYLIMLLLILASIPMSLIEPLRYSFLFSQINQNEEEDIVPLFYSSNALGGLITKLGLATVLLYFADKYAYLFMGVGMLIISLIAFKIKK